MNQKPILLSCLLLAAQPGGAAMAQPEVSARSNPPAATDQLSAPLTLERAIALAQANNPELRAAESLVHAAAGRAEQAPLWSNPEFELSTEEWPVNTGSGFSDAKKTVGLSQTIPYPGKKTLDAQIGRTGVRAGEAEYQARQVALEQEVKSGFCRVLAAEELVAIATDLVRVAELSASTAQKRVEAGDLALQEQLRAEVQLEQVKTELAQFQLELAAARQTFLALLGFPDAEDLSLSGALSDKPNLALLEDGPAHWLASHPRLVAAKTLRDQSELQLRRAKLEPRPDVRLGLAGGLEGASDAGIVEFRVSLPLPLIDRSKGRQKEAAANAAAAEAQLSATEQSLRRHWATTSHRFRTAASQVALYRDRVLPRASQALALVQTGFEQGKFGLIDLLDTQRTAAEVRLAYQQKLLELNLAQAELEALIARVGGEPGAPPPNPETIDR